MKLLIDMGNTRLKWAICQDGQLSESSAVLNEQIDLSLLFSVWAGLNPKQVLISCVSANELLALVKTAIHHLWSVPVIAAHSLAYGFGVKNAYVQPETLGVDRWLALISARSVYQDAVCVVDCGTAMTLDLLNADGQHLGGFISAGIGLMKQALACGTSALPLVTDAYNVQAASSTAEAIHSGTVLAAVGLIENVLSRQQQIFQLLLTGGDAELLAGLLTVGYVIDKDLVLRGLSVIANH